MADSRFVLEKTSNGSYRFNLVAASGRILGSSADYESRQAALDDIASMLAKASHIGFVDETGDM